MVVFSAIGHQSCCHVKHNRILSDVGLYTGDLENVRTIYCFENRPNHRNTVS